MRRVIAILCAVLLLSLSVGCGDAQVINGTYHDTYGLFNQVKKDPKVCYRVIVGNVVWSVLLIETFFMPLYFVGWSFFEPNPDEDCIPYRNPGRSS